MHPTWPTIFLLSLSAPLTTMASSLLLPRAEVNGACTGASGKPGVCISKTSCTSTGGNFIDNKCPGTHRDIKCCTKPVCGTGNKGNCRFTNTCKSGVTESKECPGPDAFKCCMPKGTKPPPSGEGTDTPPFGKAGCKKVAIDGAEKIVTKFPTKILKIGCKRKCTTPEEKKSDHCDGEATDLMVAKDKVKTKAGQPIAQWISENAGALNVKYVIWGQRIWFPSDGKKPWSQWSLQKSKNDVSADHWDHVHVSYK